MLSFRAVEFRRTHDLVMLLDLLQDHGWVPPDADWLDELNPYAVEARYGMIELEFLDRTHALDVVTRVIAWAEIQITPQPKTLDTPHKPMTGDVSV